jgi:HEAT repeat protein
MTDTDSDVAYVAAQSAKKIQAGTPPPAQAYITSLTGLLKDKTNDVSVRLLAAKALGNVGKSAATALDTLKAINDEANVDPDLKTTAANAVKKIQP